MMPSYGSTGPPAQWARLDVLKMALTLLVTLGLLSTMLAPPGAGFELLRRVFNLKDRHG